MPVWVMVKNGTVLHHYRALFVIAATALRERRLDAVHRGMTKYRKGPKKDHKGTLYRTTEDQQS